MPCTLTPEERAGALANLEASRSFFLESVAGLNSVQAAFKSADDRWSVAEIAEHLAFFEGVLAGWMGKMDQLPAAAKPASPDAPGAKDAQIVRIVSVRGRRVQAPPDVRPAGRYPSLDEAVRVFTNLRDANMATVSGSSADFRRRVMPHPFLGPLDLYQWFLFAAAHSERHTRQILEVKADPGFPK